MVKVKQFFDFAVEEGITEDPRGEEEIERILKQAEEKQETLEDWEKKQFDEEQTWNPYPDSRIHHGEDAEVEHVLVGIDIETQDLVLADRLQEKGKQIDCVIGHHPEGKALAYLHDVMDINIHTMHKAGVSIAQAEAVTWPRIKDVKRGVHHNNHTRPVEAAQLLNIPYMNLHTMTDNHVHYFIKQYLEEENDPTTLQDILKLLLDIPEYEWAAQYGMGPTIFVGEERNRVGNIAYDMTGGTELDADRLEKMAGAGIDTIVGMHMAKEQVKEAEEQNINVVIAGHMASDSVGMNLLLDKAVDKFGITVETFSGFKRVSRL